MVPVLNHKDLSHHESDHDSESELERHDDDEVLAVSHNGDC